MGSLGHMDYSKVLVVGGGPSGLLLALMLAKHGIQVNVVEALPGLDQRPRGAGYGPAASQVFKRAGVLDKIIERCLIPDQMAWRRIDGTIMNTVTGLRDCFAPSGVFMLHPAEMLAEMFLEELHNEPLAKVYFHHKVISVGQDEDSAWADIEVHDAPSKRLHADVVVGCDGASSIVRKSLFGSDFPGKTWDKVLVATNLTYDFDKHGWKDASWIMDPEDFAIVCPLTRDGQWRVSYGDLSTFSEEELRQRMASKLRRILPGSPEPEAYQIHRFSPYKLHQRCAERMCKGRIVLAADAAHLCNPMGGLGLTSGIADIGALTQCIFAIYDGKADMSILNRYDEERRNVFHNVTDPTSTANLLRVMSKPPDVTDDRSKLEQDAPGEESVDLNALVNHELRLASDIMV